jgi:ferrochelatase
MNSPAFKHDQPARTAVLLVALGTPRAPTAGEVRAYLGEFLSDRRVVEIPRAIWWPILHGIVLRTRPARSAAKYATIWTEQGSPLKVNSERQAALLGQALAERGVEVELALAMRYGEPSVRSVMAALRARRVERLLVLPMYPQYSATTTAAALDAVMDVLRGERNVPEVRWVRHFHDDPGYIAALRDSVLAQWQRAGRGDKLVMSFHGLPRRNLELGDPYHCECHKTGRLLAEALGLAPEQYVVTFQSRFGRAEWLQPYTEPMLRELGRQGLERVDVICPAFVADCLETLEEIAQEGRAAFLQAGGRRFEYIACLNDSPAFIQALADVVQRHSQGWPLDLGSVEAARSAAGLAAERALAQGAAH